MVNYRAIERVAFRTALLVAALVLVGLAFQQLITLFIAVLATVLVASCSTRARRAWNGRGCRARSARC